MNRRAQFEVGFPVDIAGFYVAYTFLCPQKHERKVEILHKWISEKVEKGKIDNSSGKQEKVEFVKDADGRFLREGGKFVTRTVKIKTETENAMMESKSGDDRESVFRLLLLLLWFDFDLRATVVFLKTTNSTRVSQMSSITG